MSDIIYNPYDVFVVQRNATSSSFEEKVLSSAPNSIVFFDSASNVVAIPSSSISAGTAISTSYAITSSHAINSDSSSYLNPGANIYLSQSAIYSDTGSDVPPYQPGTLYWEESYNTYTISSDNSGSDLQIGQELYTRVQAGEDIPQGSVVFISGVNLNGVPIAYLALADIAEMSSSVIGISTVDLENGDEGFVTNGGVIDNLNTFLFNNGDIIYLSYMNSGSYDINPPPFPYPTVTIGTILYAHPTIGKILVNISPAPFIPYHNNLKHIQGGNEGEYYHLTGFEYTGSGGSGSFIRQDDVINNSIYSITSSQANSASYINPGATFYVVSGSSNVQPAYIEPYDIPTVPYNPPYKEGRMFYDKDYSNWVYYTDQNFKLHIGKEVIWKVNNPSETTIPTTTVVYLSGSINGLNPDVYPAIADGTGLHSNAVGVIRWDIPSGSTGYVLETGVVHDVDMTGFNIGDQLWLSNIIPGKFINYNPGQPYENVNVGFCQAGGTTGSLICSININPPPPNAYAGITSPVIITDNYDGTVTVSTGSVNLFGNSIGNGLIIAYPLAQTDFTLITGSTNYIDAQQSGSSEFAEYVLTNDATHANGIDVVRVALLDLNVSSSVKGNWEVHEIDVGIVGLALANRTNNKDILLYGFQRQSGLTLFVTGSSGDFGVTSGTVWYGPNSHILGEFQSSNTSSSDTYHYVNSASVWTYTNSVGFDNSNYNDSGGLVPLSPNSWSVNFIYRLATENATDVAIVLSSQQFDNAIDAVNGAKQPPDLPSLIANMTTLVGLIAVQSGSYTNVNVESAYSALFAPATVTQHNSLLGLQGGIGGEYYHLTEDEYTGTGTGVFIRTSAPSFAGATAGNIPYWNSQQQLTLTGAITVLENQYLVVNSGSTNLINPETLLVKQLNTTSENNVGCYSIVNDFSQVYNQNFSSGSEASTDIVATSDVGNEFSGYIDMGIGSSGYASVRWPWVKPLDGYIQMDGGDFWLALNTDNQLLFTFNNTASTNYADKTGFYLSGSWYGTSSWSNNSISASWSPDQGATTLTTASTYSITSSFAVTSSNAITSSFALTSPATTLTTASIYQITSSNAISASWAPVPVSASWSSQSLSSSWSPDQGATTLTTGSTYQITSSNSISASFALMSNATTLVTGSIYQITSSFALTSPATTLVTASTYQITASNAISASWSPNQGATTLVTASTYQITASNAISASWSPNQGATTLVTASTYQITASNAITSSFALTSSATTLTTASTYQITASNAISASWSPNQGATTLVTASTYSITSSWSNNTTTASFALTSPATTLVTASTYQITSSFAVTSSNAITSSFALTSPATTLVTASTYSITSSFALTASFAVVTLVTQSVVSGSISSSWASQSLSASYAIFAQSSPATTLTTASTYPITSSWAVNATNSGTQLTTASTYPITSSWANNAIVAISASWASQSLSASWAPVPVSASWASQSLSASWAPVPVSASWSSQSLSASWAPVPVSVSWSSQSLSASWSPNQGATTLTTASTYQITSSWSSNVTTSSFALTSPATTLVTASTYQITASNAISSSWSPVPVSASWASQSLSCSITNENDGGIYYPILSTGSSGQQPLYVDNVDLIYNQSTSTTWLTKISSSNVIASVITASSVTSSLYGTASWSSNAITSSYISTSFSRGGIFYNPLGLAGSASFSQSVIIWRSPVNCTVTNVWGYLVTGSSGIATASINARKNGSGTIATASSGTTPHLIITTFNTWTSASSLIPTSSSFSIGDKLEIMLISSSGFPNQVAVQIDFIK